MLPFKLIYSDDYYLPIGAHVFPAQKYRLIHKRLLESGLAVPEDFITPEPAQDEDILLVHTREYVRKLKTGTLSAMEEQQMEVPYSPELVKAFWLSAGGSILAADWALRERVACNIGGGFHHAFPDHGEGFCVIHDVAVAIKRMHKEGRITRAMTVDATSTMATVRRPSFRRKIVQAIRCPASVQAQFSAMFMPSRVSEARAAQANWKSLRFLCIRRITIRCISRHLPLM
jgi:hypothetical protein